MPNSLEIPTEIDLLEFLSTQSHDLKAPFNRVMGFIKLVMKGMDGPISNQAREDLTTAHQNGLYALALMSGLVEMARLERNEYRQNPVTCQLDRLVGQLITDWKRLYPKESPLEVISKVPAVELQVDEELLRKCLSNWMSYVAEFVQGTGGEGHASASPIVEMQVVDQDLGAGIGAVEIQIRSVGQKHERPPECELTIYGYVAQRLLGLIGGFIKRLVEDEQGALVSLSLPK